MCSVMNKVVLDSNPVAVTWTSDISLVSNKELFGVQATIDSRFTLKCVREMIITYSYFFDVVWNKPQLPNNNYLLEPV